MKTVYICGASDCFTDPDFVGQSWVEHLQQKLPNHTVINLAVEGASNFVIRLQIDRAIERDADHVIAHFTSSVRQEIRITGREDHRDLLDRFYRHHLSGPDPTLLTLSFFQSHNSPALSASQQQTLREFQLEFFDIDLAVKKNYYLIQGALDSLVRSNRHFVFSQGGFEHPDFVGTGSTVYHAAFRDYDAWRSDINLWDFLKDFRADRPNVHRPYHRPWFHITDANDVGRISDYYRDWVLAHDQI